MNRRSAAHTVIQLTADLAMAALCIVLAFATRAGLESTLNLVPLGHGISVYLLEKGWIFLVIPITFAYYRGYGLVVTPWDDVRTILKGLFMAFLIVWVILSLQKEAAAVSRIIITLAFVYMGFALPLGRLGVKYLLYRVLDRRRPACLFERRQDERMNALRDVLNREWYSGYVITENIQDYAPDRTIHTCFVPMECADESSVKALKQNVKNMIFVSSIPGLSFMNTEVRTFLTKNIALITTSNGLLSGRRVALKRALDVVVATLGVFLFLPLFAVIPLLIKAGSKGPVFFLHERCGMNLAPFRMVKYRTMYAENEGMLEELMRNSEQARRDVRERNKLRSDPRVTGIGKILRRMSLDELPQFFNVLKGEMSLVGPRPDMEKALHGYKDSYAAIYSRAKPGMTGLWQVSGRSEIEYAERVKLDYLYVLNWSIWLDLVIIMKTFRALFGGRGAY